MIPGRRATKGTITSAEVVYGDYRIEVHLDAVSGSTLENVEAAFEPTFKDVAAGEYSWKFVPTDEYEERGRALLYVYEKGAELNTETARSYDVWISRNSA